MLAEGVRKIGEDPNLMVVEMANYKGTEVVNVYQEYEKVGE